MPKRTAGKLRRLQPSAAGRWIDTAFGDRKHQANEDGADEAILLNTAGDLCEGATSNIFIVMDGQIQTPELASGCLPGVMRQVVLEMCEKLRLPHIEKNLKLEDLLECECS